MRSSLTVSLLLFVLLVIGIGCHDKVDVQPTPPIINLASCRIVKATYKTIYISGPKTGYEQLTVAGKTFDVYDSNVKQYTYDEKGRLFRELSKNFRSSADNYYDYSIGFLFIRATVTNDNIVTQVTKDTIRLNTNGFDDNYQYDGQGQVLFHKTSTYRDTARWEANNKTLYTAGWDGGKLMYISAFDLTRKALPTIYAYQGVPSQNLINSWTIHSLGIPFLKDGPLYRIDYTYEYDVYGRVKRQIEHDTKYPGTGWSFGFNPGGIGITDFDYECP